MGRHDVDSRDCAPHIPREAGERVEGKNRRSWCVSRQEAVWVCVTGGLKKIGSGWAGLGSGGGGLKETGLTLFWIEV